MSTETFVNRFKEAREKKNITIKALQPLVGASPSALNGYATGKNLPPLEVAIKIAQELDVSLDWLCGLRDETSDNGQMTAGKLVRMLSCLLTAKTRISANKKIDYAATFISWYNDATIIIIEQDNLPSVMDFASWRSFIGLYRNGTIDAEMYNAWIEKKAKELDSIALPMKVTAPSSTEIETDDLPF